MTKLNYLNGHYKSLFPLQATIDLYKLSKNGCYVTPPISSFVQSPEHRQRQRPVYLKKMAEEIREGKPDGVRMIRLDELTEFVDSVDGVHYGFNVNRVLFSIYLNKI